MKVPIEVILQDPSGPSPVPTPTPTPVPGTNTDCECTTVSVPNTGMQTAADVTNNVSVGLVIVASLIFAVAIGTLMLYLFHLYNHQKAVENKEEEKVKKHEAKKAKAHKWSRGLFIASGATAVLAFAAFIGSFIFYSMLQPKGTSATSTPTPNESTYITTSDKITIVANRYDDVTIVANTVDSVFSTTDTTFGYKLFMSMAGEDNKLYLDGDNTSEYYFSPTTSTSLDNNSWGYNLNSSVEYNSTPLISAPAVAKQTTSPISEEQANIYFAIKANNELPYGTYKGEIEYDIKGYNGFPSTLTYMQDMTTAICDAVYTPNPFKADGVTVEDNVPTAILKDNRDDKEYTIAKLADGKCWMTQNLNLEKESLKPGVSLTSANTNNPAEGFELPASQTSGSESWYNYDDQETAINTPHLFDVLDNTQKKCLEFEPWGACRTYSEDEYWTAKEIGNYYNWTTATAGTGVYSTDRDEQAAGSICPKGWRLPDVKYDHSEGSRIYLAEIKDFSELLKVYGAIFDVREEGGYVYYSYNENSVSRMYTAPLNLVRSGSYDDGVSSIGSNGYLWSSRASSTGYANDSYFGSTYVSPWSGSNKYSGYSVRCVAE